MLDPSHDAVAPAPAAGIERRIRWRIAPVVVFGAIMLALGVVALMPILSPSPVVSGLPAGPEARAAADLLRDRFQLDARGLRFQSALLGAAEGGRRPSKSDAKLLARAESLLRRARVRSPGDPRVAACFAELDLLRRDLAHAERGFRAALDVASRYGEARIGLGVTLAMRAAAQSSPSVERRLLLQAIAQFAVVDPRDPAYEPALYDHALALDRVGRRDEAVRRGRAYLARDSKSPWAERLRRELGIGE